MTASDVAAYVVVAAFLALVAGGRSCDRCPLTVGKPSHSPGGVPPTTRTGTTDDHEA